MLISDEATSVLVVQEEPINSSSICRAFDSTNGTVDLLLVHFVKKQVGKIYSVGKRKDVKYISAFLIQVETVDR
jgi:hypothetical protein